MYLIHLSRTHKRRPLHISRNNSNKSLLISITTIVLVATLIYGLVNLDIFNLDTFKIGSDTMIDSETIQDNFRANNQSENWMLAENIYQFKIQQLDDEYFYISSLKNKVILLIK